jgi:muramidase (phage lysozyme)
MAISSPLKSKIPKSSTTTVKKFQTILFNRTRVKKEIFQNKTILQNRRVENERRVQAEEELEAPDIATKRGGPAQLISGSAKGFFERILGFLGYLSAGWIINNLPTWISMGKEFIARTQQMGKILGNFIKNTTDILKNFTGLLGASLTNIIKFDFLDTSGRVGTAFDELNLSVENWGTGFEDVIKLITTPLTEGIASGEDARPTGTKNTDEGAYETPAPYSGSDVSGYGTKEQQALLKTIRFAEGTAGSTGYSMFFGDKPEKSKYGDLTKLSANEVEKLVTKFLKDPQSQFGNGQSSAAVGAYQIIDITAKARSLGMDMNRKFDQNFQDEMALRLAAASGVTSEVLKREGLSDSVIKKLSPEWASFPGNTYGQPTKRSQDLKSTYQASLSSPPKSSSPPKPISIGTTSLIPQTGAGGFLQGASGDGKEDQGRYGVHFHLSPPNMTEDGYKKARDVAFSAVKAMLNRGSRIHLGNIKEDIPAGASDSLIKSMILREQKAHTQAGRTQGGIDLQEINPNVGPTIAGLPGSKIAFPLAVGKVGSLSSGGGYGRQAEVLGSGGVVLAHGSSGSTASNVSGASSPTTTKSTKQPAPTQSPAPPQAQITPTGTPQNQQINQSLTPERKGQTVIVSQNPSQQPQQTTPYGGGGSSGGGSSPQTNEITLLNIFMKNKLLLDLAYL